MTVIAMTREMGTRGKDVAAGVAERLGLDVVHHEIVEKAVAERLQMPEGTVHRFLEGEASLWERWKIDRDRLSRYTAEEILELADRDDIIIRGWGAAQLLAPVPHVVRVRVCAPMAARITEMQGRLGLDDASVAQTEITRSDTAHEQLVRTRFSSDWQDATAYALVLNTADIPIEACVDHVCQLANQPIYKRTDESTATLKDILIEERVRTLLESHGAINPIAGAIKINSEHGRVTLDCLVSAATDIEDLIERVKNVPDVIKVTNKVRSIPLSYAAYGP